MNNRSDDIFDITRSRRNKCNKLPFKEKLCE